MIAPPAFASIEEHVSRLGDIDFWGPYLAEILRRHDLADAGRQPVAGFNATYPTFLCGDVVVKLFGCGAGVVRPNERRTPSSLPTRRSPRPVCWVRVSCTTITTPRGCI
jgi:hypothetical protein